MKIKIKNCNNINSGEIEIIESKLNIKYGINGTGKSTIAKAIQYKIGDNQLLKELAPFGKKENPEVEISDQDKIKTILTFNEDYLGRFLYKKEELISNSFEIFIKTPDYESSNSSIENLLRGVKETFSSYPGLDQMINDFEVLSKNFKTTQTGISKTAPGRKALENGNMIENIPEPLKSFSGFLQNDDNRTSWLDWQIKGEKFLELSNDCPYCVADVSDKKETIKSISKTYERKTVEALTSIIAAVKNLGDYFTEEARSELIRITKKSSGIDAPEEGYIFTIKGQIDNLFLKLKALKDISPNYIKEDEDVKGKIQNLKIRIELFDRFNSEKTNLIVNSLNESLDKILLEISKLQGEINKQRVRTKKLIEENEGGINSFLKNAGYKYEVTITDEKEDNYKLRLRHIDNPNDKILGGNQHLSFGEKNAFALVLFMYEALSKNPDLIVLDDPISSFDKNKKYAIMQALFLSDKCLKNKTVLMMTHDIEPIVDMIKVLNSNMAKASFLLSKKGALEEKFIEKSDIMTFSQICNKLLEGEGIDEIIKLIYLRRDYEIRDDIGDEYQVLSNLLKGRSQAQAKDLRDNQNLMDEIKFKNGVERIKERVRDFDYNKFLQKVSDKKYLKSLYDKNLSGYVKLQLFRIMYDLKNISNSVLHKFINETYHIENELICQLDPNKFDATPSFVIEECDNYIANLNLEVA